MTCQKATEPIPMLDSLPVTLKWMRALAQSVLTEPADNRSFVRRRAGWLCARAVLAGPGSAAV